MRQDNQIFYRKIQLPFTVKRPVLAFGSQTKNTVCFAKGNSAYLSRLHPDLSNPKDFLNFEKEVKYFFKKHPKIIACDLHPEYQSTKYAQNLRLTTYDLRLIQHHHAHIASCMVENGLKNQKVIGVAFDGTGLGADNHLWGGEFLICDYKNFQRAAHLKEIPLLGGERAILEPWRLLAAWSGRSREKKKWRVLKKMYAANFNSPLSSSIGRLFDAVASLVLAKAKAQFEAELAIELEKVALNYLPAGRQGKLSASSYKFKINSDKNLYILNPTPVFKEIIADLKAKEAKTKIAYRFHLTIATMIQKICALLREKTRINQAVLSGGVFQNRLLLSLALNLLSKAGFTVFRHQNLSSNDSGISLGQAVIANFRS